MNCRELHDRDLLEGYVHGRLPVRQRDTLEQHLLACRGCATQVETALHLLELARDPR